MPLAQGPAADISALDIDGIHRLGNHADCARNLITLHFYAPPLDAIDVFLAGEQRLERTKLHDRLESVHASVSTGDMGCSI